MSPAFLLDNVRIILSHTSHPGNIGATARAMKTMGLRFLYLVKPASFPDKEAERRSAGAWDILNQACVCQSLDEALSGTVLAAAITARPRNLSPEVFDSRTGAAELLHRAQQGSIALVFGTEMSGLTTMEVSKCQMVVHIPANSEYSSLNLASAVQVMAYELRMALADIGPPAPAAAALADFDESERFHQHLERIAIRCGFLDPDEPKRLMQRMRRLFGRARLEREEINILRGILSACEENMDPKKSASVEAKDSNRSTTANHSGK